MSIIFVEWVQVHLTIYLKLSHQSPSTEKQDTNYRKAILANERLAITLRYLATGDSCISLAYTFKVLKQTLSRIIPEVRSAIIEVLKEYVKVSNYFIIIIIVSLLLNIIQR